ncbi:piezo-type mechanosensitive ion channel component 2-like [Haliotis cracherodii]|uniref:piezo-type mechanosensitive ion channel component 2-like n=1 Tax=Haliotis cracherodii TaxID=6455 RepID=UPI0039E7B441
MNSKVTKTVCYSLFRILLPLTLLGAAVLRYNALSFLYAVFLLITPLLSYPSVSSIKGATGNYLKVLIALGVIAVLTQCIFHIVLVAIATDAEPYGSMFPNCSMNEKLARLIAVERLDNTPVVDVVRLVVPDVAVFIVALLVFIICHVVLKKEAAQQQDLPTTQVIRTRRPRVNFVITFFGEFLLSLLIGASGIILPSVLNAVYFLTFLVVGTVWACYRKLGRKFAGFRVFLLVYTGLHILLLHLYQFEFFQDFLPPDDLIARLLGLTGIIYTDCSTAWMIQFYDNVKWPYYVNPGILLLLYWVLAFETRHYFHGTDVKHIESTLSPTRVKKGRGKRRTGTEREVAGEQDETGSVMFSGSAYGEPDDLDEKLLVDDAENTGYSTIEPINADGTPKASTSREDEETDEEAVADPPRKEKEQKRTAMVSMFVYIMKQSYVLTLIAMMAWSITFHSWLTFVLLLLACILWMIPKSRRACLVMSPVIVFYAEALLIIQFIYGMNLPDELPTDAGPVTYSEIGLKRYEIPCLYLAAQVLFTLFFWLTLRQFMRERQTTPEQNPGLPLEPVDGSATKKKSFTDFLNLPLETDMVDGYDSNSTKMIGNYLKVLLCKYWVFACATIMLVIAIQDVVVYRIIYMFLFLLFVIAFQLSFTVWRGVMYIFWWVVTVYSMGVLIIIYTYQFKQFPGYWSNSTGLSDQTLKDIGLELYDTAGLFIKLLTPTSFLIVVILQVHYFHSPFLRMSALDRYKHEDQTDSTPADYTTDEAGGTTDTESEISRKSRRWRRRLTLLFFRLWNKASSLWGSVSTFLWRLTEIHIFKLVVFVIVVVAVNEVSAISAVYIILMAAILPISRIHIVLSHVTMIWTALVILAKMMYQLHIVKTEFWITSCTLDGNGTFIPDNGVDFGNQSIVVNITGNVTDVDNAIWVGLAKISSLNVSIAYYIRNYLLILIVVAIESITRYHQIQHYNKPNVDRPAAGIIFQDIKRPEADKSISSALKYFANYLFYKFGLEICYIMSAITICIRVDAYAVIYAIMMGILLFMSRRSNARIWPLYVIVLTILLPVQFMSCVGFPFGLCINYPWHQTSHLSSNLEQWLFLPDYVKPPHALKLVADFFQLLFVCLQWRVFSVERGPNSEAYGGGDNQSILPEVEANMEIPVPDFTTSSKSYLDVVKYAVFEYMFWVTLAIVFITGTARINLFSMGYVIGVFCFMWYGQDLLIKPLRKLLKMWNFLVGYTFFVLFCKACLQLVGCVYIDRLFVNECWLIQLLGINCLSSTIDMPSLGTCTIEEDNTGLTWDVICFVFLLLQRRIYSSHYFRHVVSELEAQNRLASRGAELINRINIREVALQNAQEAEILQNIKKKMKNLQAKQAKLKKNFREPQDHFDENNSNISHDEAIRSGDYYLFDDDSEDEAPDQADTLTFGQDTDDTGAKMGPLQMISTAMDSGTDAAVEKAKEIEESQEGGSAATSPKTGPKAGPSSGADVDPEESEEGAPEKAFGKAKRLTMFILAFLGSIADWLIRLFNKISKNYRRVARQLEKEMILEREKIQAEKKELIMKEKRPSSSKDSDVEDGGGDAGATSDTDLVVVRVTPADSGRPDTMGSSISLVDWEEREKEEEEFEKSQPRLYRLLVATYYVLVARSELLCYFLMILNQMIYASLLALPLPLMVFLWGMLSVPRPSKSFWITVITYVEAVVVVKYLFQFSFFPWNDGTVRESPFWPPRILGIEKQSNYAAADLALLLALFIHRSLLKRYGLWRDTDDISADLAKAGEKELSPPCSPAPEGDNTTHAIEAVELGESGATSDSQLQSSSEEEIKKKPSKIKIGLKKCVDPFRNFFSQVTGATYNATVDVYAPMFCCDFITFIIVVFGYWAFGPAQTSSGDVTSYISENRVPVPFLVMLVCQFALIIIDRALFLRKNVLGKFIFQIILVILIHIWMFFVLPAVTDRSFNNNIPALLWYFIKCIYFGLSAYQIRCGYPTRILGNFLTKKYNYLNLFLFKGFLAIPFLLELRALMDWIWTDTTLAIGSWLQMEDIYANIFVLKCWRRAEATYPTPRAQKRKALIKYGVGGLLLLVIIFIIWFPLVLFSFANTVFEQNPPFESTVTITLGGYQPIFKMTAQQQNIEQLTPTQFNILQSRYSKDRNAMGFLSNYEAIDVTKVTLVGKSTSLWGISPPSQADLVTSLQTNKNLKLEFFVSFVREPTGSQSGSISNDFTMSLDDSVRTQLIGIINGTSNSTVDLFNVFPRFMRLALEGRPTGIKPLLYGDFGVGLSNVSLGLFRDSDAGSLSEFIQWWELQEIIKGDEILEYDPKKTKKVNELTIFTFNDRKAPAGFSVITGYGIIGLYVSLVLVIGRFFRVTFFTGSSYRIMFEELPNVDNVLHLCLDIYMVRESRDYLLEEDLFSKLLFLYRSPETLIKWTKRKIKED